MVDDVLSALAEPIRRRLLDVIVTHGEATATTVAAELPITRQAVAKHLAVLDRAGLVTARRQGREVLYAIRATPLATTAEWLTALAFEWDHRLAAIKRRAESLHAEEQEDNPTG